MSSKFCVLIAIGFLTVGRALPDVIDVSVSGGAGCTGRVQVNCVLPGNPACGSQGFLSSLLSFSGSNSMLGTFVSSGSTFVIDPNGGGIDSLTGQAEQTTTVTADSLTMDLKLRVVYGTWPRWIGPRVVLYA